MNPHDQLLRYAIMQDRRSRFEHAAAIWAQLDPVERRRLRKRRR